MKWYRKAADQGYAGAQKSLGLYYANGQGVTKDEASTPQNSPSTDSSSTPPPNNLQLATMGNPNEHIAPEEDAEAFVERLRNAAAQGDAIAQINLKQFFGE